MYYGEFLAAGDCKFTWNGHAWYIWSLSVGECQSTIHWLILQNLAKWRHWSNGLRVTRSVRNVKRDFANGFLIAEIFSRYHMQDIRRMPFIGGWAGPKQVNRAQIYIWTCKMVYRIVVTIGSAGNWWPMNGASEEWQLVAVLIVLQAMALYSNYTYCVLGECRITVPTVLMYRNPEKIE